RAPPHSWHTWPDDRQSVPRASDHPRPRLPPHPALRHRTFHHCGLRIEDCGLTPPILSSAILQCTVESAIRNPQSSIRNYLSSVSSSRRSCCLARCNCVLIVPSGRFSASASSSY